MDAWLWTELHELFEDDDGSLPHVLLNFKDRQAVVAAYARLRELGQDITHGGASIQLVREPESRPLVEVPNAAQLVASGEAESFHLLLGCIEVDGRVIPDLGVYVDEDRLVFDYRMGPEWTPASLTAFFALLLDLSKIDSESSMGLEDHVFPEVEARFQRCWQRFKGESGS